MKQCHSSSSAFTLVELLVIVAVLAILATLLVPGLAQSNKSQAATIRCLDNHAQLIKAWQLYAADSDGYVANNYTIPGTQLAITKWRNSGVADAWAPNLMTYSTGASIDANSTTNTALARAGLLVPYHGNIDAYRCPADRFLSRPQKSAGWAYRLRSVAMNSNWGRTDPSDPKNGNGSGSWAYGAAFRQWYRTAEIRQPANMFVFVDEHADSINDGFFLVNWAGGAGEYPGTTPSGTWGDTPGFYHNKATPFGFADGHTELKRWLSRNVPVTGTFASSPADLRDQQWYVQHVAERR